MRSKPSAILAATANAEIRIHLVVSSAGRPFKLGGGYVGHVLAIHAL